MRAVVAMVLSALAGCASLDTLGMSVRCRDSYDACLNTCPQSKTPGPGQLTDLQIDVASCTDRCNREAKLCK